CALPVSLGTGARAAGDGSQLHVHEPQVATVQELGVELLEERPVGLVEDHAEADHAGTEVGVGGKHRFTIIDGCARNATTNRCRTFDLDPTGLPGQARGIGTVAWSRLRRRLACPRLEAPTSD